MAEKTCLGCEHCVLVDEGYSNWTVEGTTVYCFVKKHPSGEHGFDRWYGEDAKLKYAEQCESFSQGDPTEIDVDNEVANEMSREEIEKYRDYLSSYAVDARLRQLGEEAS